MMKKLCFFQTKNKLGDNTFLGPSNRMHVLEKLLGLVQVVPCEEQDLPFANTQIDQDLKILSQGAILGIWEKLNGERKRKKRGTC